MPNTLSAVEARRRLRAGTLTSVELVTACLTRIEETDGSLQAWAHLEPEYALAQAGEMDAIRQSGRAMGSLHGIPVGLKDIVDTRDLPTERGSAIFAGRRPQRDAALVERLRDAGAVVLGKTVTTEFAYLHPAATRNPHDPGASPGGSSSGSAAAVAAFHVPLAVGTQTNGSVIRPASFCGTYGFKPTRGMISRRGVLRTSETLDQIGVFARGLEDAALLADALGGYDPTDPLSFGRPRPRLLKGCRAEAPIEPDLVLFDLPYDDRITPDARAGLLELIDALGPRVERMPAPDSFAGLVEAQKVIHEYEMYHHLEQVFSAQWEKLSTSIRPALERARGISEARYQDALGAMAAAVGFFEAFFKDYDAVLSLSAAGEAPRIESGTGDPIFCTIWTLSGLPALTLPLLVGESGLPVGVQMIGAAEQDDRLLRTASWVLETLESEPDRVA